MNKFPRFVKASRIAANVGEVHTWADGGKRRKDSSGKWVLVTDEKVKAAEPDTASRAPTAKPAPVKMPAKVKVSESKESKADDKGAQAAKSPAKIKTGNAPQTPPPAAKAPDVPTPSGPGNYPVDTVKKYKSGQWDRLRQNMDGLEQLPDNMSNIMGDERRPSSERDAAAVALMSYMTGFGAGSVKGAQNGTSTGIGTLTSDNVEVDPDNGTVALDFMDRNQIRRTGTIADEELALYLVEKLETTDQRSGFMFDYDEQVLNAVMDEAGVGSLSLADVAAAANANNIAAQLSGTTAPHGFGSSPGSTFEFISDKMHNTSSHLSGGKQAPTGFSRVPPAVMAAWAVNNGLGQKHADDLRKADDKKQSKQKKEPEKKPHLNDLFKSALEMGGTYAVTSTTTDGIDEEDLQDPIGNLLLYPIPDVVLQNNKPDDTGNVIDDVGKSFVIVTDLLKGAQPPPGYQPTPSGHGYRKRNGDHWEYWYPTSGHASAAAEHHGQQAEMMRKKLGKILQSRGAKPEQIEQFLNSWIGHENASNTFKRHASAMQNAEAAAPDVAGKLVSKPSAHPDGGGTVRNIDLKPENIGETELADEPPGDTEIVPSGEINPNANQDMGGQDPNDAAKPGVAQGQEGVVTPEEVSQVPDEVLNSPDPAKAAKTFAEMEQIQSSNRKVDASHAKKDKAAERLADRTGLGMPQVKAGQSFEDLMRSPEFEDYVNDAKQVGVNREQVKEIFANAHSQANRAPARLQGAQYIQLQAQIRTHLGDGSEAGWKQYAQKNGDAVNTPEFRSWAKEQRASGMTMDEAKTKWRGMVAIATEDPSALFSPLVNERINYMVQNQEKIFGQEPVEEKPPVPVGDKFKPSGGTGGGQGQAKSVKPAKDMDQSKVPAQAGGKPKTKKESTKMPSKVKAGQTPENSATMPKSKPEESAKMPKQVKSTKPEREQKGNKVRVRDDKGSIGTFNTKKVPRKVKSKSKETK